MSQGADREEITTLRDLVQKLTKKLNETTAGAAYLRRNLEDIRDGVIEDAGPVARRYSTSALMIEDAGREQLETFRALQAENQELRNALSLLGRDPKALAAHKTALDLVYARTVELIGGGGRLSHPAPDWERLMNAVEWIRDMTAKAGATPLFGRQPYADRTRNDQPTA